MHIAAVCPRCESRYQLDESLRGKRMRCPNPLCKTIFEVRVEGEPPAPEAPKAAEPPPQKPAPAITGSVTDMLPVLSAELAEPAPPKPPEKQPIESKRKDVPAAPPPVKKTRPPIAADPIVAAPPQPPPRPTWQDLPPPVRSTAAPISPPTSLGEFPDDFPGDDVADSEPATADSNVDHRATGDTAPIRAAAAETAPATESLPTPIGVAPLPAHASRRWPLLAIAAMLILLAGTLGVGYWIVAGARAGGETDRFKRAEELYEQQDYAEANEHFNKLVRDFATGPGARKYRFLAQLSGVRAEAYGAHDLAELTPALDHMLQFLAVNQNDALMQDRHADIWQTLRRLTEQLTDQADKQHERPALAAAEQAWAEAQKFQPPPPIGEKFAKEFARVKRELDVYEQRQAVVGTLNDLVGKASATAVQHARAGCRRPLAGRCRGHGPARKVGSGASGGDPVPACDQ